MIWAVALLSALLMNLLRDSGVVIRWWALRETGKFLFPSNIDSLVMGAMNPAVGDLV
jgi:hypothetical protein